MKPQLSENKKSVLLYLITTIEEEMSLLSCNIEDNPNVSDDEWEKYEEAIDKLYILLRNLKEEVEYS